MLTCMHFRKHECPHLCYADVYFITVLCTCTVPSNFEPIQKFGHSLVGNDVCWPKCSSCFCFQTMKRVWNSCRKVECLKVECHAWNTTATCAFGRVKAPSTSTAGGAGKGREANDSMPHGASVTLHGLLMVNSHC
jgi:hypothetical protein